MPHIMSVGAVWRTRSPILTQQKGGAPPSWGIAEAKWRTCTSNSTPEVALSPSPAGMVSEKVH